MGHGDQGWLVRVIADDDTLRQERLTRDLYNELQKANGISVGFVEGRADVDEGHKGGLAGDVALWAAVTAAYRQTSQVLMTLIKEWCTRERHRKVEVTVNNASVTITGRPDEAQERIVRSLLERVAETRYDEEKEAE